MTTNSLPALREVMTPQSFEQAVSFSQMVSKTQFVPQAFRGKPDECLAAITYGAELGLSPMQALRGVAVINGAPAVYGDTMLAVCQSHPHWAGKEEWLEGDADARTAHCVVKRKGEPDVHATFSVADAKEAQLWNKQGPWKQYPNRMLKMRARSFALRDQFSDALRGVIAVEEAGDYQNIGPDRAKDVTPRRQDRKGQPERAPEYVELYSAHGEEFLIEPVGVDRWISDQIESATGDELEAMVENNPDRKDIATAVEAEFAKRGGGEPSQDPEREAPPPSPDPPAEEPVETSERAAGQVDAKAEKARDRFMTALKGCKNLSEAAELDHKLGATTKLLGEHYADCAAAMQAKVDELKGAHPMAEVDKEEPAEWRDKEGRVEDERQQEMLGNG